MSVNFNLAMLRSLQQPIEDSLENTIAQLSQYVAGTLAPADFDAVQHIHLAAGSLTVIGCQAAARLANALELAAEGLARPERRGWVPSKTEDVARASLVLAQGLLNHLRELLADNEDLPVRLWPAWQALTNAMEDPPHSPEELFEPAADFEDQHFVQLADDYLKDVTDGMVKRIEAVIASLSGEIGPSEVAAALREALKVFDWAYGLRHGRGYQAYWLALRARLSIGLMGEPDSLEDRAQWNVLLREALLEIHKFARNARRVRPELLMKTLRPMLVRWPSHWTNSHPTLAEASRRLGFAAFWEALDEVQATRPALANPVPANEDQQALVTQLKQDWSHYVAGEGADIRVEMEKSMALLATRRANLDVPALDPLLDEMALAAAELPAPAHVPEEIALEFAAALLLLEDAVERRGRQPAMAAAQANLSQRRLSAARQGQLRELRMLPPLRWDTKKAERQVRQAHVAIFGEIHKDIVTIEEALAERLRDESTALDLPKLRATASLAAAVLRSMECHGAAAIVDGIARLASDQPSPEALSALTLGVAGLGAYLSARENGDAEADHLLQAAHQAVVGKPLPTGTLSEDEWRRTQKPIEEHVAEFSGEQSEALASTEVAAVLPSAKPVEEPAPPAASSAPAVAEAFKPEWVMAPEGYEEIRKGVPIEDFFLEEMGQVLEEIQIQRGILAHDPFDAEARATLRRQFHTIKGSGRLAGFQGLGELAYRMETRLTQDMEDRPAYGPLVDHLVEWSTAQFEKWFAKLRAHEPALLDGLTFQQWLDQSHQEQATDASVQVEQAMAPADPAASPDVEIEQEQMATGTSTPWPPASPGVLDVDAGAAHQAEEVPVDQTTAQDAVEADALQAAGLPEEAPESGSVGDVQSVQDPPLPVIVDVEGFGRMDQESYGLLVADLDRYRPILASAASSKVDDLLDIEPVHRAAHTSGSLGATLGMPSLARLGRAFEHYAERLIQGRADAHAPWTELGQEASEALWLLLDDLVERQRLSDFDETLLPRLTEAATVTAPSPTSVFDELADEQVQMDDPPPVASGEAPEQLEAPALPAVEVPEPVIAENVDAPEGVAPVDAVKEASREVEAVDESVAEQDAVQGDAASIGQLDDEQLWEIMFDSLATISEQIRRLGPVLAILSERRR